MKNIKNNKKVKSSYWTFGEILLFKNFWLSRKVQNENGQIALIIILVMTAALGIGLSIINRSLTDISTSTQVEQSSRAFSAAEAGVERALQRITTSSTVDPVFNIEDTELQNAKATVDVRGNLGTDTIEFEQVGKEDVAQVWLADPTNPALPQYYTNNSFEVFFGDQNITTNKPALEVNVITRTAGGVYQANRTYIDSEATRPTPNGFTSTAGCTNPTVTTTNPDGGKFLCRHTVTWTAGNTPILARFRILYSTDTQALAVRPITSQFPPNQVKMVTSVGTAGNTQRTVRVTTQQNVVPPLFDYVLFSVDDIQK